MVNYVNQLIAKENHVDANIFIDKEMVYVAEENANGIENNRVNLTQLLKGNPFFLYRSHNMPHVPIGASEQFRGTS